MTRQCQRFAVALLCRILRSNIHRVFAALKHRLSMLASSVARLPFESMERLMRKAALWFCYIVFVTLGVFA